MSVTFFDSSKFSVRKIAKSKVFTNFKNSLKKSDMEESCHWAIEINLSGWYDDFWDTCFLFISNNINVNSPKLPIYILQKYEDFRKIQMLDSFQREEYWKNIWIEIVGILSMSMKQDIPEIPRTDSIYFPSLISQINNRYHPWVKRLPEYSSTFNEYYILIGLISNICYDIQKANVKDVFYYISSILEYESKSKGGNQLNIKFSILPRSMIALHKDVNEKTKAFTKLTSDWIWLLWDVILFSTENEVFKHNCILCLKKIFSIGLKTNTQKKQRLPFLLNAILIASNVVTLTKWNDPILNQEDTAQISIAKSNIHIMVNEIKNEITQTQDTSYTQTHTQSVVQSILPSQQTQLKKKSNSTTLQTPCPLNKMDILTNLDPYLA
jgi:hypothetical protein